jgi:FAD/FMN-containing dehydrogenase
MIAQCRPSSWIAHGLNGIVLMEIRSAEEVGQIREKYRAVIERAPLDVRRRIATFGLDDIEYGLMKKMKDAYDPEGRLNPGRHVDGERHNG